MKALSLILSFISIVISAFIAWIPVYRKYLERNNNIVVIACDGIIRNNTIYVTIAYVNRNWRKATITNCYLRLESEGANINKTDNIRNIIYFEPIVLNEQKHYIKKLEFPLPGAIDIHTLDKKHVFLHLEYIDFEGKRISDSYDIGELCISGINTLMILIDSHTHKLQGRQISMSMKL